MVDMSDVRVMRLFAESTIDAYAQTKCVPALEAVLASTGWSLADLAALSRPFDLLVIAHAGMIECHERGGFKKRLEVGDLLPWGDIVNVAQTEPTLRVFGIEVTDKGGAVRTYRFDGGGSREALAERNRIYDTIASCMGV